jgi:hypothetical protein
VPSRAVLRPASAPFVTRAVVEGANHLTIVGAMGQPGDATTSLVFDFVRRVVAGGGAGGPGR